MDDGNFVPVGEWADRAACKGKTDLFFSHRGDQSSVRKAKKICNICEVKPECLEHALHNFERYGIRAGLGPRALSKERMRRGIAQRQNQPFEHGTRSRYVRGCRCDDCRAAQTKYQRKWRETL
jgi:hypothetical protein